MAAAAFATPSIAEQSWQERAVFASRASELGDPATLRADLTARIARLTGRVLPTAHALVDAEAHRATATVDGVLFRLDADVLTLDRHCARCGAGHFESREIRTLSDLGSALARWRPLCPDCADLEAGAYDDADF